MPAKNGTIPKKNVTTQAIKPGSQKKRKSKLRLSTVLLLLVFLLVVVLALLVYADPRILDPISQAVFGAWPIMGPDQAEVARWTKPVPFNPIIDEEIRLRMSPITNVELPSGDMGKVNPFVALP